MKVFRLQQKPDIIENQASQQDEDWFNIQDRIEPFSIYDPEGGKGNEPTSIPSPFARMDLINTALRYVKEQKLEERNAVSKSDKIAGRQESTFLKIVSHFLDVAEIFYNYNRWKGDGKLKIYAWNKFESLEKLKSSGFPGHNLLGRSLAMYLAEDNSFNFNKADKIYLLEYEHRIIGGTSPKTMFFTSGNDLSKLRDLAFPRFNRAFDDTYTPLHSRDLGFQKMLYSLRKSYPDFRSTFFTLSEYMDYSLEKLEESDKASWRILKDLDPGHYRNNFAVIEDGVFILNDLQLLGYRSVTEECESDFFIAASVPLAGRRPMVLQKGHSGKNSHGKPMKYCNGGYNENIPVPFADPDDNIETRMLPGLKGVNHPYLTISDFLEPYLIKTLFPVNGTNFFIPVEPGRDPEKRGTRSGFIIPLKRTFFKYFTIDDLMKGNHGMPMLTITPGVFNEAVVKLSVPVVNGEFIEYSRIYYPENLQPTPDENINKGTLMDLKFDLAIYPFLRLNDYPNFYRVALVDRENEERRRHYSFSLKFFEKGAEVKPLDSIQRSNKESHPVSTFHYVLEKTEFDIIELNVNTGPKGLIIPRFRKITMGARKSVFSFDFGTSNSHIEYFFDDGNEPTAFSISDDVQIGYLHDITPSLMTELEASDEGKAKAYHLDIMANRFLYELLPEHIEKDRLFSFPFRTSIASVKDADIFGRNYPMATYNIPFYYEKEDYPTEIRVRKDLKWDIHNENEIYLKHFFECLIMLIRNKILLNGGSLNKTTFIWSYPTSMLPRKRDLIGGLWKMLCEKYLSPGAEIRHISESLAPFYYLNKYGGITSADRPVISIDIGGETADIVIFEKDTPKLITSFRFAANAIFGDGFNRNKETNGFVQKYQEQLIEELKSKEAEKLVKILKSIISSSQSSADIVNSFFSIDNNRHNNKSEVSFVEKLKKDDDFNILFVLFYSAIIYHLGNFLKLNGIKDPGYLSFSGMGSKMIDFVSVNPDTISKLTHLILSGILDEKINLTIRQTREPKELTAKGSALSALKGETSEREVILLGDDKGTKCDRDNTVTFSDLEKDDIINGTVREFEKFVGLLGDVLFNSDLDGKFGFRKTDYSFYKTTLLDSTRTRQYIRQGIQRSIAGITGSVKNELAPDEKIAETLFFYPLTGHLNDMAFRIYNKNA
jgi:hypothetical protein